MKAIAFVSVPSWSMPARTTLSAESYDRDLTDIFAIQSEVAQAIAGQLSAALSPDEQQRIEKSQLMT